MKLEKLNDILRKLEGVSKSTLDEEQKKRVNVEINRIKNRARHIEEFGPEEVLNENEDTEEYVIEEIEALTQGPEKEKKEEKREKKFKILSKFPIQKIHPESTDPEVNSAITYTEIFEIEFWGALSDFHLKLDYYHSKERDKFYNALENVKRFIREYVHTLNEISNAQNDPYLEKLKLMKNKHSRSLLIDSVKFITGVYEFVEELIVDYDSNGNIVTNADEKITFSSIEGKRLLNKWTIIDSLRYIKEFCEEFIEAIPLPDEMLNTG